MRVTLRINPRMGLILLLCVASFTSANSGIIYRNPRVYNVEYSFELSPDPNQIDRSKDLRLWIPIPREWDSQKAVKIISVDPKPHAKYVDPEHGNPMLFWDFGKHPEKPSYKVHLRYRFESYEIHAEIDPNKVEAYDRANEEYMLYTRSTPTARITPRTKEIAQKVVGDEKNAYRQAEAIFKFVDKKVRYKMHRLERGVGTDVLLNHPLHDEETGEEYYEGACGQQHALFVALCRAAGIPARPVAGFLGGSTTQKEKDLQMFLPIEVKCSPEGLAGTQHYIRTKNAYIAMPHVWAEFYLPGHGWIPVDLTIGNRFGHIKITRPIMSKGFDVLIGPDGPADESEGYGFQWVLAKEGRADLMQTGVWNIAKIRTAKMKMLLHRDPFPATAFQWYMNTLYPKTRAEHASAEYRRQALSSIHNMVKTQGKTGSALDHQSFICHMLREVIGDDDFFDTYGTYVNERVNSGKPVSTERFKEIAAKIHGKPLDWFWGQWLERPVLPQLKLHDVHAKRENKGWHVRGILSQLTNSIFRLPVVVSVRSANGREQQKLWLDNKNTTFEFYTRHEPRQLIVDPNDDILKIQEMPPFLSDFWKFYPNYTIVYGTVKEIVSNRAAAQRFCSDFLGLDEKIITADADVNDIDLKDKCTILFGRPESNTITERFKDSFPIQFNGRTFSWQGRTYDEAAQGVIEVIKNPNDPNKLFLLCAGVGSDAMRSLNDLNSHIGYASYLIFNGTEEVVRGYWPVDKNLVWTYEQ